MYLTPIVIKHYVLLYIKSKFLKELRRNTREPYFDNTNSRRRFKDGNLIFANEFDNFIFLKNEIFGTRMMVNKTLVYVAEKNSTTKLFTISYLGGFGGLFAWFAFSASLFIGVKSFIEEGNFINILIFVLFYFFFIVMVNKDCKQQNGLVREIIDNLANNQDEQEV